jgi:hypothetical protein
LWQHFFKGPDVEFYIIWRRDRWLPTPFCMMKSLVVGRYSKCIGAKKKFNLKISPARPISMTGIYEINEITLRI